MWSNTSYLKKSHAEWSTTCWKRRQNINAEYYINYCLKPVIQTIKEQRPTTGFTSIKMLHDNAKSHVAKKMIVYLERENIKTIRHPPCSPDLAPCDFWLFDYIKQHLNDHSNLNSLQKEITKTLNEIPKEEYAKTFKKWLERMQLCINNDGYHF